MKVEGAATKEELQKRLKRIEGQVRGVQKMLDEDRDCHEIVQQTLGYPIGCARREHDVYAAVCVRLFDERRSHRSGFARSSDRRFDAIVGQGSIGKRTSDE